MKTFILLITSIILPSQFYAQCVKGNCQDGKGKYIYSDNSTYAGQFKNGYKHGRGVHKSEEGTYKGSFTRNKRHGEGKITYNSGDTYIGQFKSNLFSGKGKFTYSNGDIYKGEWADGKKEGQGTYIYHNSKSETGHFVNDKFLVQNNITQANENEENNSSNGHSIVSNNFTNQSLNLDDKLLDCNQQKCDNVIGRYTYSDGSVYEGYFMRNTPQGEGKCNYSNGNKYQGGWKNHSPHGIGVMTFTSGIKYGAEWSFGNPIRQITDNHLLKKVNADIEKNTKYNGDVEIFACIVGIASYTHMPSLKYTDDDAYQIYAFLKSPEGGALKDENIEILIDDAATKNNILYEMESICKKADSNDVVLVYLSGHGLQGSYIPSDFDGYNNNLPYSDILQLINQSSAKHKICIADACHSGSMYASKNVNLKPLQNYYSKFDDISGGTAFLTSSKSEELSLEYSGLRHGVFSHFLIQGLKGTADENHNGIITLMELFQYVKNQVQQYTNNQQTPTLMGNYNQLMPLSYTSTKRIKKAI